MLIKAEGIQILFAVINIRLELVESSDNLQHLSNLFSYLYMPNGLVLYEI